MYGLPRIRGGSTLLFPLCLKPFKGYPAYAGIDLIISAATKK